MEKILSELNLLRHPFYQDWIAGRLSSGQLRDYAAQYYRHVSAFPRYLSALHSRCVDPGARRILLENLNDEEGFTHGKPHPVLWAQFAQGIGVTHEELEAAIPRSAIENVVTTFFETTQSSFAEGIGALYAYESQVPEIATSKIEGLKANYGIHDPSTLEFFEVHRQADVYHREGLRALIDALPAEEKRSAEASAARAAQALWDFLSDVHGARAVA